MRWSGGGSTTSQSASWRSEPKSSSSRALITTVEVNTYFASSSPSARRAIVHAADQAVGMRNAGDYGRQFHVTVRDVHHHDSMRGETRKICRHRLARHQVDRDRVGGKRVEHHQVVFVLSFGQGQTRIAEPDRHVRRGIRVRVAEIVRIARHLLHAGVDLVEGEIVARLREAREGAGAEPDHRDLDRAADTLARRLDGLAHRRIVVIVGDHRRSAGDRLAIVVAQPFGAMDRGAVQEHAELAVGRLVDLVHAEEAAHGLARFAVGPVDLSDDEHEPRSRRRRATARARRRPRSPA